MAVIRAARSVNIPSMKVCRHRPYATANQCQRIAMRAGFYASEHFLEGTGVGSFVFFLLLSFLVCVCWDILYLPT
jgi:hypothetical protein